MEELILHQLIKAIRKLPTHWINLKKKPIPNIVHSLLKTIPTNSKKNKIILMMKKFPWKKSLKERVKMLHQQDIAPSMKITSSPRTSKTLIHNLFRKTKLSTIRSGKDLTSKQRLTF